MGGLLVDVFNPRPRAANPGVLDDFWYVRDVSGYIAEAGGAGVALSPESILRCGTVLAAVRFRGDSWAMCPPSTYIKTARGRKEDPTHYSQIVLRNPNAWQTGNRWRHLNGVWMALWGNGYSEIKPGRTSFAEQLWPLHPAVTKPVDQRADGSLIYITRRTDGREERLGQERMLHFRDIGTDGIKGVDMYRLMRNVVGIALLAEQHASTFLRKGTRISGLLVPTAQLGDTQRKELRDSINESLGGPTSTGALGVLPYGVDLKPFSSTHREAQFAELSELTVGAILRFLGVPGVVVGWADKTATYASAEAFFEKGGIKHCVLPILINVEAEEEKALLMRGDSRQIKHNLDVLERANLKDRTESLVKSVGGPFRSVNEARTIEDMDRLEDDRYDEVLTPSNMAGVGAAGPGLDDNGGTAAAVEEARLAAAALTIQKIYLGAGVVLSAEEARELVAKTGFSLPGPLPQDEPAPPPPRRRPDDDDEQEDEQARSSQGTAQLAGAERELLVQLVQDSAARVVKRETAAIKAKAAKFERDTQGWKTEILEYYGKHAGHVAEVMRISEVSARAYCNRQVSELLADGAPVLERWAENEPDGPRARLEALALRGQADAPEKPSTVNNFYIQPPSVTVPVHVEQPRAPQVSVPVTVQPAKVTIPVYVEPAKVTVQPAAVSLSVPKDAIKVESKTDVRSTLVQEGVQQMEITKMPPVKIAEVPTTKTTVTQRDSKGIKTTRTEQD